MWVARPSFVRSSVWFVCLVHPQMAEDTKGLSKPVIFATAGLAGYGEKRKVECLCLSETFFHC